MNIGVSYYEILAKENYNNELYFLVGDQITNEYFIFSANQCKNLCDNHCCGFFNPVNFILVTEGFDDNINVHPSINDQLYLLNNIVPEKDQFEFYISAGKNEYNQKQTLNYDTIHF